MTTFAYSSCSCAHEQNWKARGQLCIGVVNSRGEHKSRLIVIKIHSYAYLCRSSHFGVNDNYNNNDGQTNRLLYPLLHMRAWSNYGAGDQGGGGSLSAQVLPPSQDTHADFINPLRAKKMYLAHLKNLLKLERVEVYRDL